jgi:transposase
MSYTTRFVGIDISKSSLDVCVLPDEHRSSFANSASGIADLIARLSICEGIARLVLEPTGGYERRLVDALLATELPVALVNAKQIRQFAKAAGQLSKTDRIDAFVLADYGQRMKTRLLPRHANHQRALEALVLRYRQLSHMIVQEKNRKDKLAGEPSKWIEESLRFLLGQRQSIIDEMTACIAGDETLAGKAQTLMSLKGIGLRTACFLLAGLPELGQLSKGQVAKLIGVAPLNRDSGLMRGKRMIAGGRKPIRDALYVAALPAIRFDPTIKAFYSKLRQNGKPAKVAIVAVIRKMIIILNARMRDNPTNALDP